MTHKCQSAWVPPLPYDETATSNLRCNDPARYYALKLEQANKAIAAMEAEGCTARSCYRLKTAKAKATIFERYIA